MNFVAVTEWQGSTPRSCGGTITGGVAQAIGFALHEKVVWQNAA